MQSFFSRAAVAVAVLAGSTTAAQAGLILTIGDSVGPTTFTCNNTTAAGVTTCGLNGFITTLNSNSIFLGSTFTVGGFRVGGALTSTNNPGSMTGAVLNQTTLTASNISGVAGSFFIDLLSQGFTLPTGPQLSLFGSSGGSANAGGTGTITNAYYADPTNVGLLSNGISCAYAVSTSFNCSATPLEWTRNPGAFSLRQIQTFALGASVSNLNTTNNLTVSQVPEPVSASLVGVALIALGLASRRRRTAAKA